MPEEVLKGTCADKQNWCFVGLVCDHSTHMFSCDNEYANTNLTLLPDSKALTLNLNGLRIMDAV